MEREKDVRWQQRFSNFEKAFNQLVEFIEIGKLNKFEEQGLIKCFEYTHELAWNVMRDFLLEEGIQNVIGSRSSTKEAFNKNLITNGQIWMDMIESRNQTVHIYNEITAGKIASDITTIYYPVLKDFYYKMKSML